MTKPTYSVLGIFPKYNPFTFFNKLPINIYKKDTTMTKTLLSLMALTTLTFAGEKFNEIHIGAGTAQSNTEYRVGFGYVNYSENFLAGIGFDGAYSKPAEREEIYTYDVNGKLGLRMNGFGLYGLVSFASQSQQNINAYGYGFGGGLEYRYKSIVGAVEYRAIDFTHKTGDYDYSSTTGIIKYLF